MSKKFEDLQSYMTWACPYILGADKNSLGRRVSNVLGELYTAYEDCRISTSEAALAVHTIDTVKILREEMLKI